MIAALFVEDGGVYCGLHDVDPWTVDRDARLYSGDMPAVAHPPCERWGRYWSGGPSAKVRRKFGDDGGCFESALASVRRCGGVLEHPEASHAFRIFGLGRPPKSGGWIQSEDGIGWICCVEQGHYGHRARKATWLYAVRTERPELKWGPCAGKDRLDEGWHSTDERRKARAAGIRPSKRLSPVERVYTPIPFRDLLLSLSRSVQSLLPTVVRCSPSLGGGGGSDS